MNKFLLIFSLFLSANSYAGCKDKPEIIAVIDTGFGYLGYGKEAKLCPFGHRDFTETKLYSGTKNPYTPIVPIDVNGHGTNVVGIIESYARAAHINYCILVLKYYVSTCSNNMTATILSLQEAIKLGANYINYSSGGTDPSNQEKFEIERFLNGGGIFVTAAGNQGANLDLRNSLYPAMYDKRIVVVGMLEKNGVQSTISNYGKVVNRWEIGRNVVGYNIIRTGTSQATAVAMGKIVAQSKNKCDIGK